MNEGNTKMEGVYGPSGWEDTSKTTAERFSDFRRRTLPDMEGVYHAMTRWSTECRRYEEGRRGATEDTVIDAELGVYEAIETRGRQLAIEARESDSTESRAELLHQRNVLVETIHKAAMHCGHMSVTTNKPVGGPYTLMAVQDMADDLAQRQEQDNTTGPLSTYQLVGLVGSMVATAKKDNLMETSPTWAQHIKDAELVIQAADVLFPSDPSTF